MQLTERRRKIMMQKLAVIISYRIGIALVVDVTNALKSLDLIRNKIGSDDPSIMIIFIYAWFNGSENTPEAMEKLKEYFGDDFKFDDYGLLTVSFRPEIMSYMTVSTVPTTIYIFK